jgi:hypothetical protein
MEADGSRHRVAPGRTTVLAGVSRATGGRRREPIRLRRANSFGSGHRDVKKPRSILLRGFEAGGEPTGSVQDDADATGEEQKPRRTPVVGKNKRAQIALRPFETVALIRAGATPAGKS